MRKENVNESNIDDLIAEWHDGNSELELYDYLGLSIEEYFHYVNTGKLPD